MPRITPPSAVPIDPEVVEDDEFYPVTIGKLAKSTGSAEFGGEEQLTVDWDYEDGSQVRDYVSFRLGKQQNGTVAKLRQLLNAVSGKKFDADVAWFDSDTLEWSYEKDGPAYNKLTVGLSALARGLHGEKRDGQPKFTINAYRPVKKEATAAAKPKPTPAGNDDSEKPPF